MVDRDVNPGEGAHPEWEGAVVGFLGALESGMLNHLGQDRIIGTAGNVLLDLMRMGVLDNFSEVQRYLEDHDSPMQLSAMPVSSEMSHGFAAVDVLSGEPREFWLCMTFGKEEIAKHFAANRIDREENLRRLTDRTGFLAPRPTISPN